MGAYIYKSTIDYLRAPSDASLLRYESERRRIDLIRKLDPVDYTHSGAPHSQAQSHVVNLYNFDISQNSSFSTTLHTMTRTKQAARRGRGGRKSDGANTRPKGDGVAPTSASLIGELLAF